MIGLSIWDGFGCVWDEWRVLICICERVVSLFVEIDVVWLLWVVCESWEYCGIGGEVREGVRVGR